MLIKLHVYFEYQDKDQRLPRLGVVGEYEFVTVPRVGEVVTVHHPPEVAGEQLLVTGIEHFGVEVPITHPELNMWIKEPFVVLTCKAPTWESTEKEFGVDWNEQP